MDHLLIVPLKESLVEALLPSFRHAGWRITVTPDMDQAKALLQTADVTGIALELDPNQPDPGRFSLLRHVHEFHPGTLAILLNAVTQPLQAAGDSLVHALRSVQSSRADQPLPLGSSNLTPAQQRIADLVAQAYPNREIARRLNIKEQSVRNELSRIFKKTGTWNRVELALRMRNGGKEGVSCRPEDDQSQAVLEFKPSMDPPNLKTHPHHPGEAPMTLGG